MNELQRLALKNLKASVEGKPDPSVVPAHKDSSGKTRKEFKTTPMSGNQAGDVLTVARMVKEHDEVTAVILQACESIVKEYGIEKEVHNYSHQLKHLIQKAEGMAGAV